MLVLDKVLPRERISAFLEDFSLDGASVVYTKDTSVGIENKEVRDSFSCSMSEETHQELLKLFTAHIPQINSTLDLNEHVTEVIEVQALCYKKGHFFALHQDAFDDCDTVAGSKRKVTAILYLNSSSKYNEEGFNGGELLVYGLNEKFPNSGFPIFAKKGRLVLFPSRLLHEVKPILSGVRYSVVCWYS